MLYKIEIMLGVIFLITIIILYIKFSREFGRLYKGEELRKMRKSKNFKNGKFQNVEETKMLSNFNIKAGIRWFRKNEKIPSKNIEINKVNIKEFIGENMKFTWFGHSTLLLNIDNKRIFFDPMITNIPSPVKIPFLVSRRFSKETPLTIEEIDYIDVVIISHDHYDHLDYMSIKNLNMKVKFFYVPLGVKAHLISWGVCSDKIVEFDWWDSINFEGLDIVCTPARHFSGRGIFHKNSTLWGSWVVKSQCESVFFTGDTGYSKVYKEIGDKYGPFDLAFVECGQYNEMWPSIHMVPEESIKLASDINAKSILPMHWGAFKLSAHPWNDPIKRILEAGKKYDIDIITPEIGEVVSSGIEKKYLQWWV